jgi:hypothetical protein
MGLFSLMEKMAAGGAGERTKALADKTAAAVPTASEPASPADAKAIRRAVERQIDEFLKSVGSPDPAAVTDEHGWRHLEFGSVLGRVGVVELKDGALFLRAESRIMPLPSDGDLLVPLMRELLELNFGMPVSGRIGIGGEAVWAEVMLDLSTVRPDAAAWCIQNVMSLADNVDDALKEKYGGTSKTRGSGDTTTVAIKKKTDRSAAARKAHATRAANAASAKADDSGGR